MPLFSEHISNMYYSGTPSYNSAPSYSYHTSSAPLGMSYSASYLNPGSHYSKHSSLGGYTRAPITPRWTPSTGRTYNPILSTISERSTSSPVRISSPRRMHVPKRAYALPTYTPRPIHINTADIDVSRDRYRPSIEPTPTPVAAPPPPAAVTPLQSDVVPSDPIDNPIADNGPFMPRVDGKPETGIDSSPGVHLRSTIKRGRTVVRLHTVKRKERDSPRKPVDSAADDKQTSEDATDEAQQEPEATLGWREKLSEDLVYVDKREKKTLGAKLVEKFILKDKDDDEDFASIRKDYLKRKDDETEDTVESLLPPGDAIPTANKSSDRRCSMELLTEQAKMLDSLIRSENLSMATLDLTKVGVEEDNKSNHKPMQSSIKRRKFSNEENPLQTTKSDHSIDRMKSLRDSRDKHFSKRRSLKKSASGGSLRRLDSITEFPRELTAQRNLPSIEESRQSVKNESVKNNPESIVEVILKPENNAVKIEEIKDKPGPTVSVTQKSDRVPLNEEIKDKPKPTVRVTSKSESVPLKKEEVKEKPKLKAKITATVEVSPSPPKSPIKFVVDNVTVEEKLNAPKKGISYSSNIDEVPNKIIQKQDKIPKSAKAEDESLLRPETIESDTESAPSPEPDDGNFWSKIGKRETVYLMKRKQNIQENLAKNRRALFWFPEDDEQQPDEFTDATGDIKFSDNKMSEQDEIGKPSKDQPKEAPVSSIAANIEPIVENKEVKVKVESKKVSEIKPIKPKDAQDMAKKIDTPPKIETKEDIKKTVGVIDTDITVEPKEIVQNTEITPTAEKQSSNIEAQVDDPKNITSSIHTVSKVEGTKTTLERSSVPKTDLNPPAQKESPNTSTNTSDLPRPSSLSKNKSLDQIVPKTKLLEKESVELNKSASAQDLKNNVAVTDENASTSKIPSDAISSSENSVNSPKTSLNVKKEGLNEEVTVKPSLPPLKTEEEKVKPQVSKAAKTEAKPKSKKKGEKVLKKKEKSPPATCTDCQKPLPKSTLPKQVTALKEEHRDVVRKATASIKSQNLDVRRFVDDKPKQTSPAPSIQIAVPSEKEAKQTVEVPSIPIVEQSAKEPEETAKAPSIPIVVQSEKENIPKTQIEVTKEPTAATKEASAGEGNKAESVPATNTGNNLKVDKPVPAKLTPKKPVKQEAPLRPLIATPRPLQKKRPPQVVQSSSSSESSSEEESSDEESDSSEGSGEFFECENNPDGRTSTGSNDSGFDSSAPTSPAGFVQIKKGGDTAGTSASAAPSTEPAPGVLLDELESSTTYSLFRKTGRFTPPARSIPRFRKYNIEDFHFIKVLGKGSFGKVLLTELRDTEYYYAVKCLKKDVVLEDDDVECTLIERKVLALGTNHPYLCHLFATFQTDSHLFFVMEYLNGGDLMFHIQQSGRFPESRARFYAAEIVSGLKFLHKRGIVYRDLKLDNILLDYEGHVRIADFGMCKLQIFLDKTADTFCGTPDYMAPEIIKGLKYNQTVDWWSFGVLLYEMLIGQSPFSGCDEDELFWSICNEMPSYPRFLSQESLTILIRLLDKDARTRLGGMDCMHGDVRDQDFFHSIHWDRLDRRELETPFKPRVRHPLDTQYFDRVFTGERPRLTAVEPQVLRSMDQEPFRGFSYTNPNATDR